MSLFVVYSTLAADHDQHQFYIIIKIISYININGELIMVKGVDLQLNYITSYYFTIIPTLFVDLWSQQIITVWITICAFVSEGKL